MNKRDAISVVIRQILLGSVLLLQVAPVFAADLIFSTQPRGPYERFGTPFEQVAAYLTKTIGTKVVYHHSRDWITYSKDLRADKFDIVFDEAHFVSWRVANRKHLLVAAAVPEASEKYVVIVKRENSKLVHIGALGGHTLCAMAPPNLATLSVLDQFDNPIRVPLLILVDNYDSAYRALSGGKCAAAVVSDIAFERLDRGSAQTKVIYTSNRLMPGDAFTVGPRINDEVRGKILQALLAPETATEIKAFIDRYAHGRLMDLPVQDEYTGLDKLLKQDYGFGW